MFKIQGKIKCISIFFNVLKHNLHATTATYVIHIESRIISILLINENMRTERT